MKEIQGFSGSQMLFAVLAGAAVGAAVAMLTTPKSGPETRGLITDAVANGRQKARSIPSAVKTASLAARDAFTGAMEEAAG